MAKGKNCPNPKCGSLKFHKEGAVRVCSECGAVGWEKTPGKPGSGSGKECGSCGKRTVRKVGKKGKVAVYFCSSCKATFLL